MAKPPTKRIGPPTRLKSLKEQGKANRTLQDQAVTKRQKRAAPLRKAKPAAAPSGKGVDRVGDIIGKHLNANTDSTWKTTSENPRSYWERRFVFGTRSPVDYDQMDEAFNAMDSDRELDKLMSGRSMTAWVTVIDPDTRQELVLTAAAFGDWQTSMVDMGAKLDEWVNRYSLEQEESDRPAGVKRLIIFVGRK